MRSFLRRAPSVAGAIGLGIHSDGLALAHVIRNERGAPRVAACEYGLLGEAGSHGSTLRAMVKDLGLGGATCAVVLTAGQYSLRLVDAPDVEREELPAAARWLVNDLVDFGIDDAAVDFFEIPQQQPRGRPSRIYVVAARGEVVREAIDLVRDAGLELETIDITELALRNLAALLPEDRQGLGLMHLGRREGLITLSQGGNLYLARKVEVGLDQLAELDRTPRDLGSDLVLEGESEILDLLVLEIQRSLDYYESQLGQPPLANLVIAPFEREVPEVVPHLEKNLTAHVRVLDLNELLDCAQPLAPRLQARCLSAIGAALRAGGDVR